MRVQFPLPVGQVRASRVYNGAEESATTVHRFVTGAFSSLQWTAFGSSHVIRRRSGGSSSQSCFVDPGRVEMRRPAICLRYGGGRVITGWLCGVSKVLRLCFASV
jgi:hypothetical protein